MSSSPLFAAEKIALVINTVNAAAIGATVNVRLEGGALLTGTLQSRSGPAFVVKDSGNLVWNLHADNVTAVGV